VYIIEEPMAAAIGAGAARQTSRPGTWSWTSAAARSRGRVILDWARSGIVTSQSIRVGGGDELDQAIIHTFGKKE